MSLLIFLSFFGFGILLGSSPEDLIKRSAVPSPIPSRSRRSKRQGMDYNSKSGTVHDGENHDDANDPEDEFQSQLWTYSVWIAAIPLLYYGYYKAAFCFVTIGLLYVFQSSFIQQKVPLIDKYKIKYNIYSSEDVMKDICALHNKQLSDVDDEKVGPPLFREILIVAFTALAKKYNQIHEAKKRQQKQQSKLSADAFREMNQKYNVVLEHLAVQYQDLLHSIVFVSQIQEQQPSTISNTTAKNDNATSTWNDGTGDEVISAALALLALISKQSIVRQRYNRIQGMEVLKVATSPLHPLQLEFDHSILNSIDLALLRAKNYSKGTDGDDETKDRVAAELQRKACLFIGALADDNTDTNDSHSQPPTQLLSIQIGQQGGIQTILNAISWYQYHVEVVNWGLWSIFILCYENTINQTIFLQLDGIPIMIQAMNNCFQENDTKSVVDVARHGTALIFDLLREQNKDSHNGICTIDRWKVRNIALSAGLHECIVQAMTISIMNPNNTNMDIFVMGREILVGTNYQGSIPEPPMTLIPSSSS